MTACSVWEGVLKEIFFLFFCAFLTQGYRDVHNQEQLKVEKAWQK